MDVDDPKIDKDPVEKEALDTFNGQVEDRTVSEDSDLTGQALYQEDVIGDAMHVEGSDRPMDEILLEGDSNTESPEEYEEIDKGKIYEEDGD
jgi:hypothetical protein